MCRIAISKLRSSRRETSYPRHLQSVIQKHLVDRMLPQTPAELMRTRLLSHVPGDIGPNVDFQESQACLRTQAPHFSVRIFKSYINSWATSHRMHEPEQRLCFCFGAGPDSWPHYARCDDFENMLVEGSGHATPHSLELRLGLVPEAPERGFHVALAFYTYHAIKNGRSMPLTTYLILDAPRRRHHWLETVRAQVRVVRGGD